MTQQYGARRRRDRMPRTQRGSLCPRKAPFTSAWPLPAPMAMRWRLHYAAQDTSRTTSALGARWFSLIVSPPRCSTLRNPRCSEDMIRSATAAGAGVRPQATTATYDPDSANEVVSSRTPIGNTPAVAICLEAESSQICAGIAINCAKSNRPNALPVSSVPTGMYANQADPRRAADRSCGTPVTLALLSIAKKSNIVQNIADKEPA